MQNSMPAFFGFLEHTVPYKHIKTANMNVGSILNNDSPPSDNEAPQQAPKPGSQRHSLVNLLNDPAPVALPPVQYPTVTESAQKSPVIKRNAIADITNDRDIDFTTGVSTLNVSRQGSMSEPQVEPKPEPKSVIEAVPEANDVENNSSNVVLEEESDAAVDEEPKNTSNKPRRYSHPPIWAQECGPGAFSGGSNITTQANGYADVALSSGTNAHNGTSEAATSSLSSKPVFNQSHTESVDLECSITGVIPPPSVTRTIAEWIYANFTEIPDEQRKYVELELKFGTIIDKRASHRIDLNVLTECIYTDTSNSYFDNGVHEVGWQDMCKFLDDLEKLYQEDLRKNGPGSSGKPRRKFNNLESDITDTFYQIIQRNEQPKTIRISKDNQLNPPRYTAINKQRISNLYIHNPSSMYDLRLSLSYENPIPDSDIEGILKKQTPTLTRIKKRSSWSHRPTVTKFDMTRVLTPRELKNKAGKKIVEQNQSFEVELEIDVLELFKGFEQFKSGQDSIRFEELVEIFVNNARCLNNRVTKLASSK